MKIHPLRHGVSFHPSVSSFFFLCAVKKVKTQQVLINLHLCHTKTATCTSDIISNEPAVNIVNRRDVFCMYFHQLHNMCNIIFILSRNKILTQENTKDSGIR